MPRAIGIDLGTSYSCASVVDGEQIIVIPDAEGNLTQPSVIWFPEQGEPSMGRAARQMLLRDPKHTVYSAKRLVGRKLRDPEVQTALGVLPYPVVEGPNGTAVIEMHGQQISVPELQAMMLRHMKRIAEAYLGERVDQAVITVPANFHDAQREATRIAGRIAGLNVLRVLNEPTAAALAYGFRQGLSRVVAVYDFGGGTFDFTILDLAGPVFRVIATNGDTFLGGDDFDHAVAACVAEAFRRTTGVDLRRDAVEWQRLLFASEAAKRALADGETTEIVVPGAAQGPQGAVDVRAVFNRRQFDKLCKHLVTRSFEICDRALADAQLAATQIDDVVLVGGTTYSPLIRELVAEYFGRAPHCDLNPDTAVSVGAAIQAAALLGGDQSSMDGEQALLLDVIPLSVGIVTHGGFTERIIERNASIPVEQTRTFTTVADGQKEVRIQIVQGESKAAAENTVLGEFAVDGLPEGRRGEVSIDVTFEVDTNGILNVRARETRTGRAAATRVKVSSELNEAQIQQAQSRQGTTGG